ncbi:MAG: uracil-DNA glycosylase family protein [Lacipirellulaceae bacterium]
MDSLLSEIRDCRECEAELPRGPRPILAAHKASRILIIGQAPGARVHESGVPWNDPSGDRLRDWMGITSDDFYDPRKVALVPMGFCYPGTGQSGDLPPRKECSALWHERLLGQLEAVKLTLVIGRYAQAYRLGKRNKATLTKTLQAWREFRPAAIPLPHPSPRNNRWLKNNPWFASEVLPYLRRRIKNLT